MVKMLKQLTLFGKKHVHSVENKNLLTNSVAFTVHKYVLQCVTFDDVGDDVWGIWAVCMYYTSMLMEIFRWYLFPVYGSYVSRQNVIEYIALIVNQADAKISITFFYGPLTLVSRLKKV